MTRQGQRRSRADLKTLLIDTGVNIVMNEGVGTGRSNVTYKRVFDRLFDNQGIRVTGASVHERIWSSVEEFQLDILRAAAAQHAPMRIDDAVMAAQHAIEAADLSTEQGRLDGLRKVVRAATAVEANKTSRQDFEHWLSIVAVFLASPAKESHADWQATAEIVTGHYGRNTDIQRASQSYIAQALGLQARESIFGPATEKTFHQATDTLASCVISLSEGQGLRAAFDESARTAFDLPTGSDGSAEEWNIFGLGSWSIATNLFEPIPDWQPPTHG